MVVEKGEGAQAQAPPKYATEYQDILSASSSWTLV